VAACRRLIRGEPAIPRWSEDDETGAASRPVPFSRHLQRPPRWVLDRSAACGTGRRPSYGVDRRRPADRLVVFNLPQEHQPLTPAQVANTPADGIPATKPYRTIDVHVVGLIEWAGGVVYDDIDRYPSAVLFTPALTRELLRPPFLGAEGWTEYGLQLDRGAAGVSAVEREIGDALPPRTLLLYHVTSLVQAEAQSAIAPEVITLWVLGLIAAFAALVLVLQAVSRQLQALEEDREVMRALGAGTRMMASEGLIGIVGAVAIGSPLAAVVAVGLSPLSPIGPVRPVYPTPGIAFDWTVIGIGLAVLLVVFAGASVTLAFSATTKRSARRGNRVVVRPSSAVHAAAVWGHNHPGGHPDLRGQLGSLGLSPGSLRVELELCPAATKRPGQLCPTAVPVLVAK
jgi:hypothetical protein